ncbi:MAG: metallophosphoesterase [Sandaracinaceae bacterium]
MHTTPEADRTEPSPSPDWQRHTDPAVVERHVVALPPQHAALDGVRVVQVSDLHVGRYMRAEQWAAHVARINALAPDLVVITGDAMDWAPRYEEDYLEPLAALAPRVASLAILGNHDFYFGPGRLAAGYRRSRAVRLLRGERWESDALPGLSVWGIDDPMTSLTTPARYPGLRSWARNELDPSRFNLLLSHRPDAFRFTPELGFDLQLSGHTHGGQIVIAPWGKPLHISNVLGPWDMGVFEERASRLYVSRGLGFVGLPYRRGCSTEITVHELRA